MLIPCPLFQKKTLKYYEILVNVKQSSEFILSKDYSLEKLACREAYF